MKKQRSHKPFVTLSKQEAAQIDCVHRGVFGDLCCFGNSDERVHLDCWLATQEQLQRA